MSKSKKDSGVTPSIPGAKFLREVQTEFSKITWPTRQQIIRLSTMVIVVSAITSTYLGFLDYLFTEFVAILIR